MWGSQAAAFYQERQQEAIGLIGAYQDLSVHIDQRVEQISEQLVAARLQLAQAYLPGLEAETLERVKTLTGFLGFERRDPHKAMAHERTVLERTVQRIRADERYQMREELASADGTLNTRLVEIREMLAPWLAECEKFESLEGFIELLHVGYDTPRFDGKWWQSPYWKHWSWGDRICRELGMDDFGDDVLPAFLKADEQRSFWRGEEGAIEAQLDAIHALVQEHDQALARIPNLEAIYLEQCQVYLAEYLEQADAGLLEGWLTEQGGDRSILVALRTLAGLKAKQALLAELRDQGLRQALSDLRARASKYARKTQKYLRLKHYGRRVGDNELDRGFAAKVPRYRERQAKLRDLVERVVAYDAYQRFSLENDPALWWVEFTGKPPPRHLANTHRWYQRNSDWRLVHDTADESGDDIAVTEAVAAAAASRELDEVGYLS